MDCTREQLRKEWLEALRSGEYEQITGFLQTTAGFCCLGVACKVAEKHGITPYKFHKGCLFGLDLGQQKDVLEAFKFLENGLPLMRLNDASKLPFKEIADAVEKEPEKYFC